MVVEKGPGEYFNIDCLQPLYLANAKETASEASVKHAGVGVGVAFTSEASKNQPPNTQSSLSLCAGVQLYTGKEVATRGPSPRFTADTSKQEESKPCDKNEDLTWTSLNPSSDQNLSSYYNTHTSSSKEVMRIKRIIS